MSAKRMTSLACCAALLLTACGPTFTRGSDDPGIDDPAMSTGLDRRDLELALEQWVTGFEASPFMVTLPRDKPSIAILKIANDTSEHIGGMLDNLLNAMETKLVDSGAWTVVDNSRLSTDANMSERLRQLGDTVDPETRVTLGKEYGIHYFVNGRVGERVEEVGDTRRVQYFLFLRVTDVTTNVIKYQDQVDLTKQVED
jgi:PBP1b-binding outer membrane lipoprotein LpoB